MTMGHPELRSFAAGSRQAPDPHDQFLEKKNFYRKHTPRDPSSLFRCISEQLFDTQKYFRRVRDECCTYMLRNREYFESHVDGDFDEYMDALSRLRTKGTLLELRALAYRYQRNVILFEPYTLGNHFIMQPQYGKSLFQVFVTPDYHFDSVYKMSEIEDAAYCQSLVYEVLYTNVFRLPDVAFAVERMLHGTPVTAQDNNSDLPPIRAITNGCGHDEQLCDQRMSTFCILEDYRMCHFHNEFFDDYVQSMTPTNNRLDELGKQTLENNNNNYAYTHQYQPRYEGAMLKLANKSCVRQLLNEGITPFPYKVAKALDPYIYRNIEFDVWNDMRKQWRMRFTFRRYINVGDKCFIRLNESDSQWIPKQNFEDGSGDKALVQYRNPSVFPSKVYVGYVQYIEKMTNLYHVYVEELGQRLVVQGSTLRACNNVNHYNMINGHRRDFTVIGLSGRGRVFDNFHWRSPKYHPERNQPVQLLRNARNCPGNYQFAAPFYDPCYDANNGAWEDELRLLKNNKKNSSACHIEMESLKKGSTTGNIFEDELALKELLYSPCNDSKCTYYNEIVAMPAFITGNKGMADTPDENNNTPKKDNEHLYAPSNEVDYANNNHPPDGTLSNEENSVTSGVVSDIVDDEGLLKAAEDGQVVYGQFPQTTPGDPNVFYSVASSGPPFLANPTPTFYMPAAPMEIQGNAIYPCYRGNGPPYYFNYVYSGTTGASTTSSMVPHMLNSSGGQTNISYVSPPLESSNSQVISIPNIIQRRDLLQSETPVNVHAQSSFSSKGEDLPMADMSTLRFYYNLGVECFSYLASIHGASNALNSLQNEPNLQSGSENGGSSVGVSLTEPPLISLSRSIASPSTEVLPEADNELKALTIEENSKRNNSTPVSIDSAGVVERSNSSVTRNSTPSSHSDSGGNNQQQHQRGGYQGIYNNRRPPFNSGRGYGRGGNGLGYRGGGMAGRNMSSGPNQGAMNNTNANLSQGGEKGKEVRSQGNASHQQHHNIPNNNNNNNRRQGPGRFNHQFNNNGHSNYNHPNNNNGMVHRKVHNQPSGSDYQGDNRDMAVNKGQSQSPFRNVNNSGNKNQQHHMHQAQSPIRGGGGGGGGKGPSNHNMEMSMMPNYAQQQGNTEPVLMMNQPVYGHSDGSAQNPQVMTPPVNYYGSQVQPFPYSGPPPHLPHPFGNSGQSGNNPGVPGPHTMAGPQHQGNAGPLSQQQPMYNSPYYTTTYTTYIPLDLAGQQPMQPFGILPQTDVNGGGGTNMIVGPVPFVPQNPYQNVGGQVMSQGNVGPSANYFVAPQVLENVPSTPTVISGPPAGQSGMNWAGTGAPNAEAGLHGPPPGVPWSSSNSGTPGNINSGPSSGIGSTESSPPYNGAPTVGYANQQTPTGYAYPFPPPHSGTHHQQHFWYASQQPQPNQANVPTVGAPPSQDGKSI